MPLLDGGSHVVNNSYAYSPLPDDSHIRLVEILPGAVADPVRCGLLTGRRDASQFEALSYTWGSSSLGASIILNDACFMITNNLHLALRYLRYLSASRVMWIDAICINQLDNEERGHQVQHMRSIYQSATRVVIWLGESTQHALEESVDYQSMLNQQLATWLRPQTGLEDSLDAIGRLFSTTSRTTPLSFGDQSTLISLLNRDWWERVWVIQEVASTSNAVVQCGKHLLEWAAFCTFINRGGSVVSGGSRGHEVLSLRTLQLQICNKEIVQRNLLSLAFKFRKRLATDPRDKLFALLGLVGGGQPQLVAADYSKDVETTYREFSMAHINHYRNLLCIALPRSSPCAPWSELWNYNDSLEMLFWGEELHENTTPPSWDGQFSASGHSRAPNCTYEMNSDLLHLRSIGSDTIKVISTVQKIQTALDLDFRTFVKEHCHASGSNKPVNLRNIKCKYENAEIAFQRTITGGLWDGKPTWENKESWISKFTGSNIDSLNKAIAVHRKDNINATWSRRFFITTQGYFGLGPEQARCGDIVSIFLGSQVPLVILQESRTFQGATIFGDIQSYKDRPFNENPIRVKIPKALEPSPHTASATLKITRTASDPDSSWESYSDDDRDGDFLTVLYERRRMNEGRGNASNVKRVLDKKKKKVVKAGPKALPPPSRGDASVSHTNEGPFLVEVSPPYGREHSKFPVGSKDSLPLHRIVGQSYVHGIMKYVGDINHDIAVGKIILKDFFFT